MKQRRLGQDGPMVSAMGLGCWSFAGAYGPTTEAESHQTLDKCLELGIDFLDTANVYRGSEKVIGTYIASRPGAFKIASKGGITQLTRAMAEAWSSDGVMTNAIAPGLISQTEFTGHWPDARFQATVEQQAIKQIGRTE